MRTADLRLLAQVFLRQSLHFSQAGNRQAKLEEAESRRQFTAILEQVEGDGAEYLEYLDEYIQGYQESYTEDGEPC